MICYEIFLNGRRLCLAGALGFGVMGVNLSWVKRDPGRRRRGESRAAFDVEEHSLSVGGLFQNEHLDWVRARGIRAGDLIRIRVLRGNRADEPTSRQPMNPEGSLVAKKAYLAKMERYLPQLRLEIREEERAERVAAKRSAKPGAAKQATGRVRPIKRWRVVRAS